VERAQGGVVEGAAGGAGFIRLSRTVEAIQGVDKEGDVEACASQIGHEAVVILDEDRLHGRARKNSRPGHLTLNKDRIGVFRSLGHRLQDGCDGRLGRLQEPAHAVAARLGLGRDIRRKGRHDDPCGGLVEARNGRLALESDETQEDEECREDREPGARIDCSGRLKRSHLPILQRR
jgi:hypothetical protein